MTYWNERHKHKVGFFLLVSGKSINFTSKYWLEPKIELAENFGFSSKELSYIEKILRENGDDFKIKFTRYVGKRLDDQR